MAGTEKGGKQAAKTNKEKYGEDFYKNIGRMGGQKSRTGGFAANRQLAIEAGRKGGKVSKRKPASYYETERVYEKMKSDQAETGE